MTEEIESKKEKARATAKKYSALQDEIMKMLERLDVPEETRIQMQSDVHQMIKKYEEKEMPEAPSGFYWFHGELYKKGTRYAAIARGDL